MNHQQSAWCRRGCARTSPGNNVIVRASYGLTMIDVFRSEAISIIFGAWSLETYTDYVLMGHPSSSVPSFLPVVEASGALPAACPAALSDF